MSQQRVLEFVSNNPGKTQLEIAKGIYEPDAVQQQVNQDVNLCLHRGLFRREGMGGQNDPYRYYPKDKERGSKNAYPGTLPICKTVKERVLEFVSNNPGKTQLEIAKGIYGPDAVQQQVNQDVNLCLQLGLFRREGMGGQNDPYRYYPKDKERGSKNAYPGTLPIYKIVKERVLEFVSNNPGKTQLEIAKGIYGPDAAQQQVNQDVNLCLQLGLFGLFRREGMGGQNDPYRYYLKD